MLNLERVSMINIKIQLSTIKAQVIESLVSFLSYTAKSRHKIIEIYLLAGKHYLFELA